MFPISSFVKLRFPGSFLVRRTFDSLRSNERWHLRSLGSFSDYCEPVRSVHSSGKSFILGIETSCDDTGAAIVDSDGNILGEALHSQLQTHLNFGGIIPHIARDMHKENISKVVQATLEKANMQVSDVNAVAVTVKPGMPLSLVVGMNYAKALCKQWKKPLIPIHHMEAHALTARMVEDVPFPFMVLLASGGHCLLALVKSVDEFHLLGDSDNNAPGEIMDKAARRLKLRNIPALSAMSGGRALEEMAKRGDPRAFDFGASPMHRYRDCTFSFAGLRNKIMKLVEAEEEKYGVEGNQLIPTLADVCASFQHAVFSHICKRLQRGMVWTDMNDLLPSTSKKLVVSGGVACNAYFRHCLGLVCAEMGYTLVFPPPKLCTDNGIMIAWNGMERWKAGVGVTDNVDAIDMEPKAPLGIDMTEAVRSSHLAVKWIKLFAQSSGCA